ncbi:MAG: protochlorophyllide oxidoreductase [Symploca sp. SIO3C6]|uniref:Protochlorophyllide oxidoreductase n=1 Tax=Symploca sp. SIO1C4 TaxID=2607765 RepID=A0A6B3NLL7_9CYAN|nr:protochlorophyllide oxidoreductase [Symploca sp. SIO3C6]NER31094.1 protochlorophyllide oxidoreductase [Symploca sp. SIO1C4]NET06724.1 protochlorophyllide oxidoreductase [Symploca sp. SIO2B6]NET49896.1 protochlorophyllide oxidoreductase [Merismopedia sp. SIO2A8]
MSSSNFTDLPQWTTEAKAKLHKIPYFVRPQARKRIEQLAREADLEVVTAEIVEQARAEFGQ